MTVRPVDSINTTTDPSDPAPDRWRLNRAGIINVYQYENEVLNFAGGRLLLRGVNGSGKSTAMNMLLPFLLTARPGRIDAAGDQTGILRSWMLNGRDDAQPVGYLWIEFERQGEFLVCGCGIKASRQSDKVTTWWFVTSRRPAIDLTLVAGNQPLSADGLRAELGSDEVFGDRRRSDYRLAVQRHLFGGASIDEHIGLIHVVRSPRVGDRIDLDLPQHLVEALPQLSEQALSEAAQPLDDLDEHRRNVADLDRTLDAIRGLLDVYRAYCTSELRQRASEGRSRLATARGRVRGEKQKQRAAEAAASEVERLDAEIVEHERTVERLWSEISALEESRAYREGQQLDGLRDFVAHLSQQCDRAAERVATRRSQADAATGELHRAQHCGRDDTAALNVALASAAELGEHLQVARRPPALVAVSESTLSGTDASEPEGTLDNASLSREIAAVDGAVLERRADVENVEEARTALDSAEHALSRAESTLEAASDAADRAAARLADQNRLLDAARREWTEQTLEWARQALTQAQEAGVDAPAVADFAAAGADLGGSTSHALPTATASSDGAGMLRAKLEADCDDLTGHWHRVAAEIEFRLSAERSAAAEAQALVEVLAARTEPEPPRPGWQTVPPHCLADLIDFKPHLGSGDRSGIEAALESSGLLVARVTEDAGLELASGELVAAAARAVERPLSDCLAVTVPDRLSGEVEPRTVARLLDSISCDVSADATTAVAIDGSFRVGALRGQHRKERAEFIGATARREALERDRREASTHLEAALAAVEQSRVQHARYQSSHEEAQSLRQQLPSTAAIVEACAAVDAAVEAAHAAESDREAAASGRADAERTSVEASDELHRTAVTLRLPPDRPGLDAVRSDLRNLESSLERCRSLLDALRRSIDAWHGAAARWRAAEDDLRSELQALEKAKSEHSSERARLATIEGSIGAQYAEVLAARTQRKADLEEVRARRGQAREEHTAAVSRRAEAQASASVATDERAKAEQACDETRLSTEEALATPGLLDAIADPGGEPPGQIVAKTTGTEGLRQVVDSIDRLLAAVDGRDRGSSNSEAADSAPAANAEPGRIGADRIDAAAGAGRGDASRADTTSADSVRQSLRRRRDSLGAGWDAEERQPYPTMPLVVEVTGPSGKAPLAASVRAVSHQHQQMLSLLDQKQSDALRELLQGLIAREIAERVHGAAQLVERMNERLGAVKTAHDVGVRLRWRRSGELEPATDRMIDLLTKLPDLRTEDDERDLRRALSVHLREARELQPDVPYGQLIADALDYKRWHEMAVLVRKPGEKESRLSRRTPLSEGEKKLVTYLPLFAAVAASCDALAERSGPPDGDGPGVARFIVLDDAFAKVSEDNHAKLFGLLVDLDLDLIATSERLWGTHPTVPELAITEVVRDARLGAILLEHYRWNGYALERRAAA